MSGILGRASSPILVGRDAELNALREAVALAVDDPRRVLVVEGEAGIGKTRLLHEYAREVAGGLVATSTRIVFGRCTQLTEGSLPYGPIVEVLDELSAQLPAEISGESARLRDELSGSGGGAEPTSVCSRGRMFLELATAPGNNRGRRSADHRYRRPPLG
jgi:predicted ATPase